MACPHYQEEADRKPDVHKFLLDGKAIPGYAIDGGAAAHFIMASILKAFSFIQIHMCIKYLKSQAVLKSFSSKWKNYKITFKIN